MTEQRYRAVLEVQARVPVTEVAERFGVSRQAVHQWRRWYADEGLDGLADRSHRPRAHPAQISPEVEAAICEMRRAHPRWGPRSTIIEERFDHRQVVLTRGCKRYDTTPAINHPLTQYDHTLCVNRPQRRPVPLRYVGVLLADPEPVDGPPSSAYDER